jgi:7-cyano-7-deazaguanine synthase in queuosine biosynthesis
MRASHYGNVIGLGALKGEVNPDKSEQFRIQAEQILNTCYAPSYWSNRPSLSVVYPVGQYTKTELIREYLKEGGSANKLINETRSCYNNHELPCGVCSACVKRYIALTLNGLSESYVNNPSNSSYLQDIKDRWDTYDGLRQKEILSVFPGLLNG